MNEMYAWDVTATAESGPLRAWVIAASFDAAVAAFTDSFPTAEIQSATRTSPFGATQVLIAPWPEGS